MACWDVLGKAAGKPVYELLGGACRPLAIRSRFSMGAYDVARARARAAELVEQGFDTVKVKVGGQPEDDIARVRAVREVIGPERKLVIDANCGWDADTAIALRASTGGLPHRPGRAADARRRLCGNRPRAARMRRAR